MQDAADPAVIVECIKKLIAISKEEKIEEEREQERQAKEQAEAEEEARRKARWAELRKHPVMAEVYEAFRKEYPSWLREAKQSDPAEPATYRLSVECDKVRLLHSIVKYSSLGYESLWGEDRLLFAQSLRGALVTGLKDTKAIVGEVCDHEDFIDIFVDLSAYQKPLKPF